MYKHHNSLDIVFWNADGIKNRKIKLQDFINDYSPDQLLIQESHLQNKDKFYLPYFDFIKNDKINSFYLNASGGTAILLGGSLKIFLLIITFLLHYIGTSIIFLNLANLDPIIIESIYVQIPLIHKSSH
ncbi:hypothetical protein CEXT_586761 [Caerostris extrusa]|uniref:Endonuclease/exonuclease/phosphatase domain-containing protein n=1 Tax=Caerostris extrusa TaxID=172846 RepID=A0AAV4QT28_CAEEX|nr:hypothetical protein CEXT_586761 [Caerostris extrusa]